MAPSCSFQVTSNLGRRRLFCHYQFRWKSQCNGMPLECIRSNLVFCLTLHATQYSKLFFIHLTFLLVFMPLTFPKTNEWNFGVYGVKTARSWCFGKYELWSYISKRTWLLWFYIKRVIQDLVDLFANTFDLSFNSCHPRIWAYIFCTTYKGTH